MRSSDMYSRISLAVLQAKVATSSPTEIAMRESGTKMSKRALEF
jgi:hypothetical protein